MRRLISAALVSLLPTIGCAAVTGAPISSPATNADRPSADFVYGYFGYKRPYFHVDYTKKETSQLLRLISADLTGSFYERFRQRYEELTRNYERFASSPDLREIIMPKENCPYEDLPKPIANYVTCWADIARNMDNEGWLAKFKKSITKPAFKTSDGFEFGEFWHVSGASFFDGNVILTPHMWDLPIHRKNGENDTSSGEDNSIVIKKYVNGTLAYALAIHSNELLFWHPYEPVPSPYGNDGNKFAHVTGYGILQRDKLETIDVPERLLPPVESDVTKRSLSSFPDADREIVERYFSEVTRVIRQLDAKLTEMK